MNWLIIYWLVALLASCLYGLFAIDIFSSDPTTTNAPNALGRFTKYGSHWLAGRLGCPLSDSN
jgi:hypothetical protein